MAWSAKARAASAAARRRHMKRKYPNATIGGGFGKRPRFYNTGKGVSMNQGSRFPGDPSKFPITQRARSNDPAIRAKGRSSAIKNVIKQRLDKDPVMRKAWASVGGKKQFQGKSAYGKPAPGNPYYHDRPTLVKPSVAEMGNQTPAKQPRRKKGK